MTILTHFFDRLTSKGMRQVNQICSRFEAAWATATTHSPEFIYFLNQLQGTPQDAISDLRLALMEQIIPVDIAARNARKLPISREAYESMSAGEFQTVVGQYAWKEKQENAALHKVGKYELLEEIGRGGMGVVYKARQIQGVERELALKVLDSHAAGRDALRRFEFEGQTLATLEHDRIAKVFDTGVTDDGRAFIAMELVAGLPVTDFCQQNELWIRDRLQIMIDVCSGIQHAHQRGVIHRDLKPANILVQSTPEGPRVKIIDFGLARSMTNVQGLTEFGHLLGTLEYLSPEQAALDPRLIDTRTDVYSLGVILFELMTGTTPIRRDRFQSAGYQEILKAIQLEECDSPRKRLREIVSPLPPRQKTFVRSGDLTQDLDWVTARALAKDPGRRYGTVGELAEDLTRYLKNEPVAASPPSLTYRFRKLVTRHWRISLTLTLAMLVLLSFTATVTYFLSEVNDKNLQLGSLNVDLQARERQAKEAKDLAEQSATRAREQTNLAVGVLSTVVRDLQNELRLAPGSREIRAQLLKTANTSIRGLAEELAKSSDLEATKVQLFKDTGELLIQIVDQGSESVIIANDLLIQPKKPEDNPANRESVGTALGLFEEAIAIQEVLTRQSSTHLSPKVLLARLNMDCGNANVLLGELKEAETHYLLGKRILDSAPASKDSSEVLLGLAAMEGKQAALKFLRSDYAGAIAHYHSGRSHILSCPENIQASREAVDLYAALKLLHGRSLLHLKRLDEGAREYVDAITILEKAEVEFHSDLSQVLFFQYVTVAWTQLHLKRLSEGARFASLAFRRYERLHRIDSQNYALETGSWMAQMCRLEQLLDLGNPDGSEEPGPKAVTRMQNDVLLHSRMREYVPLVFDTLQKMDQIQPDHPTTMAAYALLHARLGIYRSGIGDNLTAIESFRRAVSATEARMLKTGETLPKDRLFFAKMYVGIAECQIAEDQYSEASETLELARQCVDASRSHVDRLAADLDESDNLSTHIQELQQRVANQE